VRPIVAVAAACRCCWPLVQADGTKSIMYKDVKRNGSKMPDGVRMNGESGGGVAGGRSSRGTMGHAGHAVVKEAKRRVGVARLRETRIRRGRADASTGEMNPARIVPAPYNVQSNRAGLAGARVMRCYDTHGHAGAFLYWRV